MWTDMHGNRLQTEEAPADMISPVRCLRCGAVYDLCKGEPIQRYADCTVYRTPCCSRVVDDREHVSLPAFRRLR